MLAPEPLSSFRSMRDLDFEGIAEGSDSWGLRMTTLQASAQKQLRQLIESIERLEEEKKALSGDIRDKYLEAKGLGFDVKVLRQIVRLRKKSQAERQEEEGLLEVYMHALGMLEGPISAEAEAAADRMIAAE